MVDPSEELNLAIIIKPGNTLEIKYKFEAKNLPACIENVLTYCFCLNSANEKLTGIIKNIQEELSSNSKKKEFVFEIAEGGDRLISRLEAIPSEMKVEAYILKSSLSISTRILIHDENNISIEECDKKEQKKLSLSVLKVLLCSKASPKIVLTNESGNAGEEKFTPAGERRMKVPAKSHREFLEIITNNKYPLGKKIDIIGYTMAEVQTHNKENDAWMVINNKIYDITLYLDYHPGGKDKLMMGAGKDGTSLFNKYHAWVSIDTLMSKFQVGVLKYD